MNYQNNTRFDPQLHSHLSPAICLLTEPNPFRDGSLDFLICTSSGSESVTIIASSMAQKQTALQKMQDIANRLISNTPELAKILDTDSALKPKRPFSPASKKGNTGQVKAPTPGFGSAGRGEMTSNDYHQKCKELSQDLQSARDKVFNLEEEIIVIKQRFVEREIQYRKIIQELQDQIKCKSSLDHSDRNRMSQIGDLHKEILDNIGTIQNKTSKILIEQESDIRRFFHKKINEIKEKFKEDKINKSEKDQEYLEKEKQMTSELEWIKNIAHKIDLENQTLMKKFSTLKSEFEIQEKDKDLLMKELLMKKKENAVLKSQVEQYEKLLNEVSKEMEDNEESEELIKDKSMPRGLQTNKMKKQTNPGDSRLSATSSKHGPNEKYENTIAHLNNMIAKEKRKVRQIKNLYMREVSSKSELEKIIRKLVDDVRDSIVEVERERNRRKRTDDEFSQQARQKLMEQLLSNEKILTMIYDKTFYSGARVTGMQKIPQGLQNILENEEDGFF